MRKEIGSNFWFNRYKKFEDKQISLDHLKIYIRDKAFLSTGRGAISFVLDHIKTFNDRKVALLPSLTCYSVIEPFVNAGYKVFYYRINKNLSCNKKLFLADIERFRPSVILLHEYFGFNTLKHVEDVISEAKNLGITVINDITQALYSRFEHVPADYYIFSFRKWSALPDGGCAISVEKPFLYKPLKIDVKLQEAKTKAFHAKHLYINENTGVKENFLKMFHDAEQILHKQQFIYAMNPISKKLQGNLDIDFVVKKRRKNFYFLLDKLQKSNIVDPIFKELPETVTPLYFTVYVNCNRNNLQNHLAKNDVYAPIIWPKPFQCKGFINSDADWIYDHILSFPCDQRYSTDDMNTIVNILKNYRD